MKTYYLIYVYRGEIKVRQCKRAKVNNNVFEPIEFTKHYYYTNLPESPNDFTAWKDLLRNIRRCSRMC